MPRLFAALPVPDEIADALAPLQNGVPQAHWVPVENLHITLAFMGNVEGATQRDLVDELGDIAGPPFAVRLSGVEAFSSGKRPIALVAKVERGERLDWLQRKVATVARNCGVSLERRAFRPHVTLARFADDAETGHHLAQFLASHALFSAGPWICEGFALYSSHRAGAGRAYVAEAEYPLTF